MSNTNFPFYNNNTFGISSVNQFSLNVFNPYSLYYYTVTVISPVFPEGETDEIELPEITFDDFKKWAGAFFEVDDENHSLHALATSLIEVAKYYIDVNLIGKDNDYNLYKRIVIMYVAHYLELHLQMLKDEANKNNMNAENAEYKIELEMPQGSMGDFKRTLYGQMFWSFYGNIARFAFQKNNPTWGAI